VSRPGRATDMDGIVQGAQSFSLPASLPHYRPEMIDRLHPKRNRALSFSPFERVESSLDRQTVSLLPIGTRLDLPSLIHASSYGGSLSERVAPWWNSEANGAGCR
jgi:hypothetical protein